MSPLSVGLSASTKTKFANHNTNQFSWVINQHLAVGSCSGRNEERQFQSISHLQLSLVKFAPLPLFKSITFTFQICSNLFLLPAVIPQLCCPMVWATKTEQRTYNHGNADWRQTLPMCSLQSLLWCDKWPKNAHASAWWKEGSHLQPVCLLEHQCC